MASFMGNRGFGSGIFRPVLLIASICLLMFLLYAYSSTNSELKQHKDRAELLTKQQEMFKTQVKGRQFILFLTCKRRVLHYSTSCTSSCGEFHSICSKCVDNVHKISYNLISQLLCFHW